MAGFGFTEAEAIFRPTARGFTRGQLMPGARERMPPRVEAVRRSGAACGGRKAHLKRVRKIKK